MLRGNLNAMFINLSRRSQSLIERQLSLIDSLEQSEQDSGRLSSLFRLDHLATRMRRNSENLLVLAGHEVTRRWSQPVPLVDVLRAAISEIEQYERVVLNVQPGIVVVGQAVNDAVHLVAEIVENATTFSPEDTQVYVSGQPLSSGGVLLDITDNGVGISDQEMSHANWRLDNPPVVDVAVSRRMGLFVVGRLAARHGVRVRLRHAQTGGLTALIWLPDTVAAPEVAPAARPAPPVRSGRLRARRLAVRARRDRDPAHRGLAGHRGREDPQVLAHVALGAAAPATPATPSFTPAANSGAPGSPAAPGANGPGGAGAGADVPSQPSQRTPAEGGTPAGNNWEPAGNGWDLGNGRVDHEGPTQALPVRNGNAAAPSNGNTADDGAELRTPASGGPSGPRPMPAFSGQGRRPRSSRSAARTSTAATGRARPARPPGGPGNGDAGDGSGQVTVPPAGQEQRLPIFDSLESDWFRRSGKTLTPRSSSGPRAHRPRRRPRRARGRHPPTKAGARLRRWRRPRREKLRRRACRGGFRGLISSQALSAAEAAAAKEVQEVPKQKPKRPSGRRMRPVPAWPASSEACARVAPPHPRSRSRRTR